MTGKLLQWDKNFDLLNKFWVAINREGGGGQEITANWLLIGMKVSC